ncbi:MAG: YSC84-related protein [Halioglobus sp.]
MQNILKPLLAAFVLTLVSQFAVADEYSDAKKIFVNAGQSSAFFGNSYAYALFPSIGKAGLGVGGAHGKGKVYVDGAAVGSAKMTQLSVGFQMGGQVYSQIIFLQDKRAFDEFTADGFEFSAQATAVAITAAAGAQSSTGGGNTAGASGGKNDAATVSAGYNKGMAVFTVAKGGLMYEAALAGQKYSYKSK